MLLDYLLPCLTDFDKRRVATRDYPVRNIIPESCWIDIREAFQGIRCVIPSLLVLMRNCTGKYLDGHIARTGEPQERTCRWHHHIPVLEHGGHAAEHLDWHYTRRAACEVIVADRCRTTNTEEWVIGHCEKQFNGNLRRVPLHQELHNQCGVPTDFVASRAHRKNLSEPTDQRVALLVA